MSVVCQAAQIQPSARCWCQKMTLVLLRILEVGGSHGGSKNEQCQNESSTEPSAGSLGIMPEEGKAARGKRIAQ